MLIEIGVVLALFGLTVMIGPFGTFSDLSLLERLQYWGFMILVNWLQLRGAQIVLAHFLTWDRFWTITLGACVIASVPATVEVIWIEGYLRPEVMPEINLLTLFLQVLALSTAIMVPVSMFFLRGHLTGQTGSDGSDAGAEPTATTNTEESATPPSAGEAFYRRIPMALGRDLHAIQAEDHYIRVFTALGDDLILHRFSDAMAELDGLKGLQVHRSWWVAERGIAETARRDRKVVLVLKNGIEAPVSRTFMRAVRDAGWLA